MKLTTFHLTDPEKGTSVMLILAIVGVLYLYFHHPVTTDVPLMKHRGYVPSKATPLF